MGKALAGTGSRVSPGTAARGGARVGEVGDPAAERGRRPAHGWKGQQKPIWNGIWQLSTYGGAYPDFIPSRVSSRGGRETRCWARTRCPCVGRGGGGSAACILRFFRAWVAGGYTGIPDFGLQSSGTSVRRAAAQQPDKASLCHTAAALGGIGVLPSENKKTQ